MRSIVSKLATEDVGQDYLYEYLHGSWTPDEYHCSMFKKFQKKYHPKLNVGWGHLSPFKIKDAISQIKRNKILR